MSDTSRVKIDSTISNIPMRSVMRFDDLLNKNKETGLYYKFRYYRRENHNSIPLIATYDALKELFSFYKRPTFQTLTDSTAIILEGHYKMLSEKMGYKILPSQTDLSGLVWRSKVLDKNIKHTKLFLDMWIRLYPEDSNGYIEWRGIMTN